MRKRRNILGSVLILAEAIFGFGLSEIRDPFFDKASQANLYEIRAGEMAEKKGNEGVVKVGREMFKVHSQAESELHGLAKNQGLEIASSPDAEQEQALTELNKLSGKSFDSAYMAGEFTNHKMMIDLFSEESKNGISPEARTYAGKYLPKLQMHLQWFEGHKTGMKITMDSVHKK